MIVVVYGFGILVSCRKVMVSVYCLEKRDSNSFIEDVKTLNGNSDFFTKVL